jgi:hypothetical protein
MLKVFGWFVSRVALFATTVLLVIFTWFADANLVNDAFDVNRWLSEQAAELVDSSGRLKTAFRFINMERVLLIMEIMAVLFALAIYLRSRAQRIYEKVRQRRHQAAATRPIPERRRFPPPDGKAAGRATDPAGK